MSAHLQRANANVARGSNQLRVLLERWLTAYAREMARREIERLSPKVAKQDKTTTEKRLEEELRALLLRFGVRQAAASAERATTEAGTPLVIPNSTIADAIAGKKTKIKWFWEMREGVIQRVEDITETTRNEVRASVRQILADAQNETREVNGKTVRSTPSMGEIARRIHTQFHGKEKDGRIRVFSPERAAVIAQTELAQAENLGIFEGYKATGIEEIEWLSRIGSERHGHMNGKRVKIGDYFVTERGNRLRFPGDPDAVIGESINCRCVHRAVIRARG